MYFYSRNCLIENMWYHHIVIVIGSNTENVQLPSTVRNAQTVFQNVSLQNSSYSSSQETDISPRSIRVAETVRTLTELKHTPASPSAVRRSPSVSRSQSAERRESIGSGLIAALNAKIAPNMSPRHSRRHSEDTIRKVCIFQCIQTYTSLINLFGQGNKRTNNNIWIYSFRTYLKDTYLRWVGNLYKEGCRAPAKIF